MNSDFSLEKGALSCGKDTFQFRMNKKLNLSPWTLFKFFFLDSLTSFTDYLSIKLMEPSLHHS